MRLGRLLVFAAALVAAPHALTASADAQLRSAAAPQQPIPAAVFARLPQTQGPQINSDGTAVAAKIRSNGQQVLAIIPLDAADARPTIVARDGDGSADQAGGERRIVNWDWVDADNLLVWI
jgi:hypothetical protein